MRTLVLKAFHSRFQTGTGTWYKFGPWLYVYPDYEIQRLPACLVFDRAATCSSLLSGCADLIPQALNPRLYLNPKRFWGFRVWDFRVLGFI